MNNDSSPCCAFCDQNDLNKPLPSCAIEFVQRKCCNFCEQYHLILVLPPTDLTDEDLEDPHYFGDLDLVNMSDKDRDALLKEADDRLAEIERRKRTW